MLRLQGFPEEFKIVVSDTQSRKQAGNSLPIPVAQAAIGSLLPFLVEDKRSEKPKRAKIITNDFAEKKKVYYA